MNKLVQVLPWLQDVWAMILQCKLVYKTREICSALSAEDTFNNKNLKSAILLVCELVQEAGSAFWA